MKCSAVPLLLFAVGDRPRLFSMLVIRRRTSASVARRQRISSLCSYTFFSRSPTRSRRVSFSFSSISSLSRNDSSSELEAEARSEWCSPFAELLFTVATWAVSFILSCHGISHGANQKNPGLILKTTTVRVSSKKHV